MTPKPTRSSDRDLVDSLPRSADELHGMTIHQQCFTMDKPCGHSDTAGAVFVNGGTGGPRRIDFAVAVTGHWEPAEWKKSVRRCPQGEYELPLKWRNDIAQGAYEPGERGTSKRTPWTVGSWEGFTCEKHGVSLWPGGEQSERNEWQSVYLNNGFHLLVTQGRNLVEAKALASEYLDRLDAG